MRANTSKIMEMKQLIQNIFTTFTPGSQEQKKYPRYGFSYLQFCNVPQQQFPSDGNMTELIDPVIFYRLTAGDISNQDQNSIDPTITTPPLNSPEDLVSNKIVINISKSSIPNIELDNSGSQRKISQQYLNRHPNIKPYDPDREFENNEIRITSIFLTNYRIEKHGEVDILYDYYDNEIINRRDQLIFGGFNFIISNLSNADISLTKGFIDVRWEVTI